MATRFLDDQYLLSNATACRLYESVAKLPLIDYHNHLPPQDIVQQRSFSNLHEAWLEGDHYKWRAMRWMGEDESLITGDADPWDKFLAWARTVPKTLRNPLYTWTHLELRRYFNIETLLNEETASEIWDEANRQLAEMNCVDMLTRFRVVLAGTTDDPADGLGHHEAIAESAIPVRVIPTFRPDRAHMLQSDPVAWNEWTDRLGEMAKKKITHLDDLLAALSERHRVFDEHGARASDHGLGSIPDVSPHEGLAKEAITCLRQQDVPSLDAQNALTMVVLQHVGRLNHDSGWAMQLHLGAMRNTNSKLFQTIGRDVGGDSMGDERQGPGLRRLLDDLHKQGSLPRTILYNNNATQNALFATMCGNFQGEVPGRVQFGAGWWYLDQEDGMRRQMEDLSNMGLLATFLGMLTDSRSFLSFPRHEVFRRILCDVVGSDAESGRIPADEALLTNFVQRIAYHNARDYFRLAEDTGFLEAERALA